MDAIEYFYKYRKDIHNMLLTGRRSKLHDILVDIFMNFGNELWDIARSRTTDSKYAHISLSMVEELNEKWNILAGLFEDEGLPIIERDGFLNALKDTFVELEAT